MIDETLYDAFGQRQVSTLFTQLNQYHVILETMPDFQNNPAKLNDIYVRSAAAPTASTSSGSQVITATSASGNSGAAASPKASSSSSSAGGSASPRPSPEQTARRYR